MNQIPPQIKSAFAKSLQHSFSTRPTEIFDGEFPVTQNSLITDEFTSTDKWQGRRDSRTTTGNDRVEVSGVTYSRAYAGGVINDQEKLKKHGITQQDVIGFLTEVILTYSDQTRLDEPCELPIGSWTYTYTPSYHPDIPMWTGVELIYHMSDRGDDDVVFRHSFMICPIIEA